MPLKVVSFCTYRTSKGSGWRERDYAACKLIKALKGKPVNGWADVPVAGRRVRLDASNAASAPALFGELAARGIKWDQHGPYALVPVPNSDCIVGSDQPPRTLKMATQLANHIKAGDVIVADVLRWSEALPPAHEQGGWGRRDPQQLYPRLRLSGALPEGRGIVLVDDVLTSGGHLRAAAAFLEAQGGTVNGAVCAGRTDDGFTVADAFALRIENLEPFTYDPTAPDYDTTLGDDIFS